MYDTIKTDLGKLGISKKELAKELNISYGTILAKLNGKSKFTFDEAVRIHEIMKSTITVEELFEL